MQVAIEVNGRPIKATEADAANAEVRQAFTHYLENQDDNQDKKEFVFTHSAEATEAAQETKSWLNSLKVCAEQDAAVSGSLPTLVQLLDDSAVDAALLIDARLHQTTPGRKAAQGTVAALAAVGAIATTVAFVALAIKGNAHPQDVFRWLHPPVPGPMFLHSPGPHGQGRITCKNIIRLADDRPHHFWDGSHMDLAIAIVDRNGTLRWFRSGSLRLDLADPIEFHSRLRAFFED
jgi:hypothetical protein